MPDGKILISEYKHTPVVTAFIDDKLEFLSFVRESDLGNIYIGKVNHIVKNLDAAFIRFKDDEIGYLPLKNIEPSCIVSSGHKGGEIKSGDEIIVQVETEALKTKKCKLTTNLCVSGKYTVITLGRVGVGASLKLSDDIRKDIVERTRSDFNKLIEEYSEKLADSGAGMIIRTNVSDIIDDSEKARELVISDARGCLDRISEYLSVGRSRTCGSCISEKNIDQGPVEATTGKAIAFLKAREITQPEVINDSGIHGINSKIESLLSNRVWLKSGAYLIIEQLESFNAIDVNTGKAIKGKENISEKVNFEAAEEIMRQIRLRNLTGMILIDFINMKNEESYEKLTEYIKALCRLDTVHTSFIDITGLGIMELTRNKNDKSLKEIVSNISFNE